MKQCTPKTVLPIQQKHYQLHGVHNDLALPVQSMHTHIEQLSSVLIPIRHEFISLLSKVSLLLNVHCEIIVSYTCTGEFGVAYRGLLLSETKRIPEAVNVAVKTLNSQ